LSIKLRPHHLLCAANFIGKGYSDDFVENFETLLTHLKAGETFEVINSADAVCAACPNLQAGICKTQEKVDALDKKHSQVLGVKAGDKLTWLETQKLIKSKVVDINNLCSGCEWSIICAKNEK
jgi:hypothetical protein